MSFAGPSHYYSQSVMPFPPFNDVAHEDGDHDTLAHARPQSSEPYFPPEHLSSFLGYDSIRCAPQYVAARPESSESYLPYSEDYETHPYIPGAYGTSLEYGLQGLTGLALPALAYCNNPPLSGLPSQDSYAVSSHSGGYGTSSPQHLRNARLTIESASPLDQIVPWFNTLNLPLPSQQNDDTTAGSSYFSGYTTSTPQLIPRGLSSSPFVPEYLSQGLSSSSSDALEDLDPIASSTLPTQNTSPLQHSGTISGPARRSGAVARARDTPYTRSGAPSAKSKKSDRIYQLQYPSNEGPLSEPSTSTVERQPLGELRPTNGSTEPILVEKDTGKDVSHLLRSVGHDRFSTWSRLEDGSRGKKIGHYWCRERSCEYHTNRKADMDDHVITHDPEAEEIWCKTLVPNMVCPCLLDGPKGPGMISKHKRSVERHFKNARRAHRAAQGAGT